MLTRFARRLKELIEEKEPDASYNLIVEEKNNQIHIDNHGDNCITLTIESDELSIDLLGHCGVKNGGTKHLTSVIQAADEFKINKLILHDASVIRYNFPNDKIELNLRHLSILLHGESWYGKYGFHDEHNLKYKIIQCIHIPLVTLLTEYESEKIIEIIQKLEIEIDDTWTIHFLLTIMMEHISSNCKHRVCKQDFYPIVKLIQLLIEELYQLVMIHVLGFVNEIGVHVERHIKRKRKSIKKRK